MVTLFVEENNPLTPTFYNSFIADLQLHQLKCPCGHSGGLSVHGYYQRFIKTFEGKLCFNICRVVCEACGKTHALLLSSMVPYFQIPLQLYVNTIIAAEHQTGFASLLDGRVCVDENNLKSILRNYRLHWCERLRAVSLCLTDLSRLVSGCFSHFSRQFMQIKTTRNILFVPPT